MRWKKYWTLGLALAFVFTGEFTLAFINNGSCEKNPSLIVGAGCKKRSFEECKTLRIPSQTCLSSGGVLIGIESDCVCEKKDSTDLAPCLPAYSPGLDPGFSSYIADIESALSSIHAEACVSQKSKPVLKDLKKVQAWIEEKCSNHVKNLKDLASTIKTHALLYSYSDCFSKFQEASSSQVLKQFDEIWPTLDEIKSPIIESDPISKDESRFNKVNRLLFQKFDASAEAALKSSENEVACAPAIVEWAENVIPDFRYSSIVVRSKASGTDIKTAIRNQIKDRYDPTRLKKYLAESWPHFMKNMKLHGDNLSLTKKFCSELTVSMCYPARKSMSVVSSVIPRQTASKTSWADLMDKSKLSEHYEQFLCRKCEGGLFPNVSKNPIEPLCGCESKREEFCENFWTELSADYLKVNQASLGPDTVLRYNQDSFSAPIQEFKSTIEFIDEDRCQ